jgi:hypothetical protein
MLKGTTFWVVTQCSSEKARRFEGTYDELSSPPASAGFLFWLLLNSENEGDMFLQTSDFLRTARRYNPPDRTPHSHRSEDLKSNSTRVHLLVPYTSTHKQCNRPSMYSIYFYVPPPMHFLQNTGIHIKALSYSLYVQIHTASAQTE